MNFPEIQNVHISFLFYVISTFCNNLVITLNRHSIDLWIFENAKNFCLLFDEHNVNLTII